MCCNDLFDDPIQLGIMLGIAEEMMEEDRERSRLEQELEPFDPDSNEDSM